MNDMPLWLVARYGPNAGAQDAAFVRASDEQEAVRVGAWELAELDEDLGTGGIGSVYVLRVEQGTWWKVDAKFAVASTELQCCGGSPLTHDGHSGFCQPWPHPGRRGA
jgi:hypothetical protein